MRYQMKGLSRENLYGYVEKKIKIRIRQIAQKAECSMRLVINTALADALNIEVEDKYYEKPVNLKESIKEGYKRKTTRS